MSNRTQFVAVVMIIPIGSRGKVMFQTKVPELDPGSLPEIAGEHRETDVRTQSEPLENRYHPGEDSSLSLFRESLQLTFEPFKILVEKTPPVHLGILQPEMSEKTDGHAIVGRASEFKGRKIRLSMVGKSLEKTLLQSGKSRTARINQGSVDVEEEELSRPLQAN